MANELKVLEGMDVVALARKHSDQATVSGQIIPWQTSLSFDPSVDSDSTVTKDGNVATKYLAWYMQVTVQEDSNDNDPDDHSTRDVTFSVNGTPKRGWTTLDDETQEQVDYVFLGVGKVTETDATGGGTVWDKAVDPGTNTAGTEPAGGTGTGA